MIRNPIQILQSARRFVLGRFVGRRRFYHSITVRNLALGVVILVSALAPLSYFYWRDAKMLRIENLAVRLQFVAEQSALRLDMDWIAQVRGPGDAGSAAHWGLVSALAQIQREFTVDNAVLLRRRPSGEFGYIADGNGQFSVGQDVFLHQRFPDTFRLSVRAWEQRGDTYSQLFGFGELEYLQFYKPLLQDGKVAALLMINKYAEDVDQAIRMETLQLLLLSGGIALLGGIVFWASSEHLLRPLVRLREAALRMAAGDLDVSIDRLGRKDEVAELNESFAYMVGQLRSNREELQRNNEELKRTLARVRLMEDLEKNLFKFVPREVRRALHSDPEALERGKVEQDVTVLFLDIEGSSVLTEAMEPRQIDDLIEQYFSKYLDCIYENHGDITETAGDGLMIIFQGEDPAQHALNAVRTAVAIQQSTQRTNAEQDDAGSRLRVNIGINSGRALVGFTRYEAVSGARVTFTASGRTTILAARLQDLAKSGTVLLSRETRQRVANVPGFAALGAGLVDMGAVALKNLAEPETVSRLDLPA